ncbi:hypothetical protein GCM10011575_03120 [Microlunatus endophyticus]|uniref:Uncharacterized protein n=1 Tax=Microlunatus endophyticus TaxID=1716077 RepID=A0A917VZK3_9ACTN|nr:hypothetical protein [Microlunatus endophyticus]GGL48562.1 hypothetical protein GCM10011575_03120 [Microlunatus endophyticus]
MSQDWAPPGEHDRALIESAHADPYRDRVEAEADELAPVDRQADPAHWLPGRALAIAAIVIGVLLVATVVVCLVIWLTPPMHHLQVPSVPKG